MLECRVDQLTVDELKVNEFKVTLLNLFIRGVIRKVTTSDIKYHMTLNAIISVASPKLRLS